MQQGGEFGRYYEDGRSSRTPRGASRSSRRAASGARSPDRPDVTPGTGRSRLRREMQQTLGSRAALRRALLLREILGPPKSLQAADDARTQPPADQQPGGSIKTQNGSYQNGVSTVPHPNGHRQLSPGVDADRPPASMLPAASAMPPRTGPADHAPPDEKTTTPSPTGLAASIVEASAGAIKRLFQRVGIWP